MTPVTFFLGYWVVALFLTALTILYDIWFTQKAEVQQKSSLKATQR